MGFELVECHVPAHGAGGVGGDAGVGHHHPSAALDGGELDGDFGDLGVTAGRVKAGIVVVERIGKKF